MINLNNERSRIIYDMKNCDSSEENKIQLCNYLIKIQQNEDWEEIIPCNTISKVTEITPLTLGQIKMTKIYAIKDAKMGFGSVHMANNKLVELRNFAEVVNQPEQYMNKFSKDFSLWELADFDEQTGIIKAYEQPQFIEEAENVKAKAE